MNAVRTRRGNTILEAALVLPILLALSFGTVEFAHFFYVQHSLKGAAREGARAAIISSATNADVNAAVSSAMSAYGLSGSGYSVATVPANVGAAPAGANVSVTVQCSWGAVGLRPLGLISSDKPVRAAVVMRRE